MLFCKKCGARTALPFRYRWIGIVLTGAVILAALAFVVFVLAKENWN